MASGRGYILQFKAAQRAPLGTTRQTLEVLVDGTVAGTVRPEGTSYQSFQLTLQLAAGTHTLAFRGTGEGDCTALVDQVSLN